jgi:DNA repair exonuclease SbcCD ATPase subunit
MKKITGFQITRMSASGFKCFQEEQTFDFGSVSFITGANHAGKTSVVDAIAFAVTGQDRYGGAHIDKLYCETLPDIEIHLWIKDDKGASHELVRTRKRDKMQVTWDGYAIRQADLSQMFGEKDEFLSIFNPLYFIETLGNDGQTLLQRNLPLIDHKAVLERLTEPEQALLENVSLLSPETFLKTIREEIRDLEEGKLVLEGQKVQLIQQQRENKEAVAQGKERMAQIKTQIDALEQKREVGIDRPALEKQLEGLHLRYEELLRDKPEEVPPELLEQLRQAELAQERLRLKGYEGKFTAALAETQAALQAAAAEHKQISTMLSRTQPGALCPTCKQPLPADAVAQAQDDLRQKLGEVTSRGQGLRSQLNDLKSLEAQARETFEQFHKEDVEKTAALLEQLRARKAEMEQELREHGETLSTLNSQIQELNASLTYGNLDDEEMQRLSDLHARKQEAEEELAALEKVAARPTPDLDARKKEVDELIRQKKLLMSAAVNYLAVRNELSFASLSMPQVKISLYDLVKTTGELKSAFRFQYNGRDYRRLSHSEKLRAGLEVSQLMKRLTGRRYPVFIDDVESITGLPKLPDQILLARVVPNAPLSVVTPGQSAPAPLKKAS